MDRFPDTSRFRVRHYSYIPFAPGVFAQSDLNPASEPEDRISSLVLEASIGVRKSHVVKTPDNLRQNGIPLDSDGPPDFQPLNVPFKPRVIHPPDNFWDRPLPANLERPTSCSCQAYQQGTE